MKLKVDRQADALYLTLSEAPASRSQKISPGIIVDYDPQDHFFSQDELRRRLIITISRVVPHVWEAVRHYRR